ncbi:type VI secretion system protein TssL, short form (plasmid) [Cronobacter dublinensis]|uniref:type VI secretion system protein TssL, short form n=1 Tax=Cronobacter dublinensis TaxID=413497 RepID=UPI00292F4530|nr:type VI secretion system protein TssL, short form [Cronobacter dublinensis]WNY85006.1 type VI secretion system protein TssL, short form [Cronobacter dublinensis]
MKNTDLDVINKTFYPGWLMVSQLRSGQEVKDGDALYRRACQWVNTAREALSQAGFSDSSVERMLYAYCALIDESVLHRDRQDDGYRKWRQDPLQARFFSTLNAGEDLWEQIRILLREPAPDRAVLTCLYRTLQLGFVGQYRAQDDERREDVVRELSARVAPFALTEDAPVVARAPRRHSERRLYWLGWGAGVVALIALWFTLSATLAHQVAQVTGQG